MSARSVLFQQQGLDIGDDQIRIEEARAVDVSHSPFGIYEKYLQDMGVATRVVPGGSDFADHVLPIPLEYGLYRASGRGGQEMPRGGCSGFSGIKRFRQF